MTARLTTLSTEKTKMETEYSKLPIVCHQKSRARKEELERNLDDIDKTINQVKTRLRETKAKVY